MIFCCFRIFYLFLGTSLQLVGDQLVADNLGWSKIVNSKKGKRNPFYPFPSSRTFIKIILRHHFAHDPSKNVAQMNLL